MTGGLLGGVMSLVMGVLMAVSGWREFLGAEVAVARGFGIFLCFGAVGFLAIAAMCFSKE